MFRSNSPKDMGTMCTHNTCIQSAMEEYSSSMPAHKKHSTSQDGTADWATVLPKPWCWARLRAGGKGGDRGWDDRTTSPTQCPWAWGDSGRYWRTRNPGVLQSMKSHDLVTEKWKCRQHWTCSRFPGLHFSYLNMKVTTDVKTCYISTILRNLCY